MHKRARRTGKSKLAPITLLILVLLLGGLIGAIVWLRNQDFADAKLVKELQQAELRQAQSADKKNMDSSQWRGPTRTGLSQQTGIRTDWPEKNTLEKLKVWEAKTGPGYSTMAVAGGRVYTLFQNDSYEAVVCWDAKSGDEIWRYQYSAYYDGQYGPGPRSTPTIDGDRIYTVGGTGMLHCLKTHPKDSAGEVIWEMDLTKSPINGRRPKWGVSFSPLVKDDLLYAVPGGPNGYALVAFDKFTGDIVWHKLDDVAGYSSPVAATLAGKEQIVFFTGAGLVGVNPKTGDLYWQYPWTTYAGVNAATPIVAGDYVFVSSGYNTGCAVVKISNTADGKQQAERVYQNKNMKNHFSSSVLYKDHLYGFSDTILTCLHFRTGELAWKHRHRPSLGKGCLLYADGHLILLGERGTLAIAKVSPQKIEVKSSFQLFGRDLRDCWSVPVLADGFLYVRDQRKIYCLDMRKKKTAPPSH